MEERMVQASSTYYKLFAVLCVFLAVCAAFDFLIWNRTFAFYYNLSKGGYYPNIFHMLAPLWLIKHLLFVLYCSAMITLASYQSPSADDLLFIATGFVVRTALLFTVFLALLFLRMKFDLFGNVPHDCFITIFYYVAIVRYCTNYGNSNCHINNYKISTLIILAINMIPFFVLNIVWIIPYSNVMKTILYPIESNYMALYFSSQFLFEIINATYMAAMSYNLHKNLCRQNCE